jgi:hypothetical protein
LDGDCNYCYYLTQESKWNISQSLEKDWQSIMEFKHSINKIIEKSRLDK